MPEHLDPSVFAAPVYIVAMIWEHHRTRRQRERGEAVLGYEKRDTIASLGTGIVSVLTVGVMGLGVTALAEWMHAHRLLTLEGWKAWAVGMIAWDFAYYWLHRFEHSVRLLWATHVSHHSSERYNFSTALRQPWLPWFSFVMLPPIALLGVEPWVILTCGGINLIYQFFVHTEAVGKLPAPIEWVFNTPSHHRVHHGIDPEYIDKNHAGVFIVWDRLFGTFAEERKEPSYGLVKPLGSFSAYWSNVAGFARIVAIARATSRWQDKLRAWIAPPEWLPADLGGPVTIPEVRRDERVLFDVPARPRLFVYVGAQFLLVSAAVFVVLWWSRALSFGERGAIVGVALLCVATWSGLFEGARWAVALEGVRIVATFGAIAFVLAGSPALPGALFAYAPIALGSAIGLARALREPVAHAPAGPTPAAATR